MATYPTYARIGFEDASGRISEVRYRMLTELTDTLSNLAAVKTELDNIALECDTISLCKLAFVRLEFEFGPEGAMQAAANNQLVGFSRLTFDGGEGSIEIPAPDPVNGIDENLLFEVNYNSEVDILRSYLRDPETGEPFTGVLWSQSRARKGRQTVG